MKYNLVYIGALRQTNLLCVHDAHLMHLKKNIVFIKSYLKDAPIPKNKKYKSQNKVLIIIGTQSTFVCII